MQKEQLYQKIVLKTGRRPSECSCGKCQGQCAKAPCLGTPQDILALIEAGYGDKIHNTVWASGMMMGLINFPIYMFQIEHRGLSENLNAPCIFFKDGKCALHTTGLKPTEGKLSHHTLQEENYSPKKNLTWNVAKEWLNPKNESVVSKIIELKTKKNEKENCKVFHQ